MLPRDISALEARMGYAFRDKELLRTALTHSSFVNEHSAGDRTKCNERLEFLGDSVLSIVTSEYLFSEYSDLPEGKLTRMRADVVCANALYKFAKKVGFGDYSAFYRAYVKIVGRSPRAEHKREGNQ